MKDLGFNLILLFLLVISLDITSTMFIFRTETGWRMEIDERLNTGLNLIDNSIENMLTKNNLEKVFKYITIAGISKCYLLDDKGRIIFQTSPERPILPHKLPDRITFYGKRWAMEHIKKGKNEYYLILHIKPYLFVSTGRLFRFFWIIRAIIYLLFIIIGVSLFTYSSKYHAQKTGENEFVVGTLQQMVYQYKEEIDNLKKMLKDYQDKSSLIFLGESTRKVLHELRNRIGTLIGYIMLIQDEKLREKLLNEAQLINRVADNILIYTHPVELDKKEIDIEKLLDEVLLGYQDKIVAKRNFSKVKHINGDKDLLMEGFGNIVKNSIEAMEGKEGILEVQLRDMGDRVLVVFKDNGKGMDEETLKNIFQPDFTTKEGGTGFGMAFVKRIVEAHNGRIKVESKQNEGTTIEVELPYG